MKYSILFCLLLPLSIGVLTDSIFAQKRPVDYVNPFIGTGGHGHTFPGATVPFGMVQLSPDTRTEGWDAASGYHYSDSTILGFSHAHLNGTGVNDLCDVLITPSVSSSFEPLKFQHKNEIAKAGYYKVKIDNGFEVELTSTERVGFHRYKFPTNIKKVFINLNPNKRNRIDFSFIQHGDSSLGGTLTSTNWAKNRSVFFAVDFNLPILEKHSPLFRYSMDKPLLVSFDVSKTHELLIKVALSPVEIVNARKNMQKEIPHWDFDKTRKEAEAKWEKYLNRIQIEGGTEDQRTIFYTALYHTLIHPSVWQDVNGDYRGLDNKVYNSKTFTYHSIFSLWDTHRATHPLYTILCPEKVPDFINGFIDDFEKAGHLPVWNFPGNETWCMIGNHSIPVIADAYLKGIKGFDAEKALNAMIKTVNRDTLGLKAYREKGYIPADTEGESVSKTLEYAYDDYCTAMMAKAMKKDDIYKEFIQRSDNWKNIFNPKTGFFQAKINETFVEPFEPREVNHHFTEGNAWQYAFSVQHDIDGLIQMLGGREQFEAKLDEFFNSESKTTGRDQVDITGLIGQYAHGNEPSHHIAYLYNYVYRPDKTAKLVRKIINDFYKNAPDGLIGNEDCGQMSAWYVLSNLGFYSVDPISIDYNAGSSIFKKITIKTPNQKPYIFTYLDNSKENIYLEYDDGHESITYINLKWDSIITRKMIPVPAESYFPEVMEDIEYDDKIIPNPYILKGTKLFKDKLQIELACADTTATIYFTTDGSNPIISGKKYTEPIEIIDSKVIKFEARLNGEHSKVATATFKKIVKDKIITLKNAPAPQYSGGAADALVDGEFGIEQWQLGGWQGFEGVDLEAVVDLGKERDFKKIILNCVEDQNAWIFPPSEIQFYTSNDGKNFELLSTQQPILEAHEGARIRRLGVDKKGKARYIKVVAKPQNPIPAWHKGAGGKGWIFADEIIID